MNIGIDIVEVKRIARLIRNKAFLRRVFTPQEIAYCSKKVRKAEHYGVRFAAKEAVWKALGTDGIPLKSISVRNRRDGKPEALVNGRKRKDISISLSHTENYAAAVAVISK